MNATKILDVTAGNNVTKITDATAGKKKAARYITNALGPSLFTKLILLTTLATSIKIF